ncbi:MAG: ABC transporter ATP-binding protein [Acidobacteriota bacterium]|nr:ABC transporter ATP-binding protein [Acidobacteriota bacterium]
MTEPLLQVRELTARLRSTSAVVFESVGFNLAAGETIGILGESGAGKTTLAKSLMGLLSPAKWVLEGSIRFRTTEILRATERQLQKIRGAQISLIFQEPELALNPVLTVGKQVDEVLRAHSIWNHTRRRKEALSILAAVGLEPQIIPAYPHQLSGGQRQRIAIAQSIISKPSLLIADEPTSTLDNVTQAAVLTLIKSLRDRFRLALIFITHNPALLNGLADRVLVMREGRIVEAGTFEQICFRPNHPYTRELLNSLPPMPTRSQHFGNQPACET